MISRSKHLNLDNHPIWNRPLGMGEISRQVERLKPKLTDAEFQGLQKALYDVLGIELRAPKQGE